jgi:hypothetical protein
LQMVFNFLKINSMVSYSKMNSNLLYNLDTPYYLNSRQNARCIIFPSTILSETIIHLPFSFFNSLRKKPSCVPFSLKGLVL